MARNGKVTIDVSQERKSPPRFSRETPASMALRFGGGVEGITAPLEIGQRVFVVIDATVKGVDHHRKSSDKVQVLERTHAPAVDGGWVLDTEAGISVVEALRIAREEALGVMQMPGMPDAGDGPEGEDG